MIRNGLQVMDEERETIIAYLGTYLGPNPSEPSEASDEAAGGTDDAEGGRTDLVDVLLHGLRGPIEVDGTVYDGVMPYLDHLEDAEIAAILNRVLTAWNEEGGFEPYVAEEVAERRGRDLDAGAVHADRPEFAAGE